MNVQQNLLQIQQRIQQACERSNRNPKDVKIIAVTKYVSLQRMKEALAAGVAHLGESKAQDALQKWEELQESATWHFIGHLQSNKVKDVVPRFDLIHSLDRTSLAKELEKRAGQLNRKVSCFVQVNVSGENTKRGLHPSEVEDFIAFLHQFSHIQALGLMTMAPYVENPEETRPVFRQLKEWQVQIQKKNWDHAPLTELSMGMSNDYIVAIEEGATYVRLGTSLVGNECN